MWTASIVKRDGPVAKRGSWRARARNGLMVARVFKKVSDAELEALAAEDNYRRGKRQAMSRNLVCQITLGAAVTVSMALAFVISPDARGQPYKAGPFGCVPQGAGEPGHRATYIPSVGCKYNQHHDPRPGHWPGSKKTRQPPHGPKPLPLPNPNQPPLDPNNPFAPGRNAPH